jgi:hypothetical protein
MPDPNRESVSASQMPALFGFSAHGLSKWMLYHHFKGTAQLPFVDETERMTFGNIFQPPLLRRTAFHYRARLLDNTDRRLYVRRGKIGHTRDGRLLGSGRGRINVEVKNVDSLVWKREWTETAAPQHIEIQAEVGTFVDRCDLTVIAACIGGNSLRFYERTPRPDFHERMKDAVARFFEDLRKSREPDPMGLPEELPMLAELYPEADETKILERLEDQELRELIRQFQYGRDQETFGRRIKEAARPKILAIAQDCSVVRANAIEAHITKTAREAEEAVDHEVLFAAQAVRAWARLHFGENMEAWPKELRKLAAALRTPWYETRRAGIAQIITTRERPWDTPLPGDDIMTKVREQEIAP